MMMMMMMCIQAGGNSGHTVRWPSKEKSKETEQRALCARWQMSANDVNATDRYLITVDITEKDKNICNIIGPLAPFRTAGPR